jgi:hypothetical protein
MQSRGNLTPFSFLAENFPHHKHIPGKVAGVVEPSILKVIEEARRLAQ